MYVCAATWRRTRLSSARRGDVRLLGWTFELFLVLVVYLTFFSVES